MKPTIIYEDESYERAFEAGELTEAGAVTLAGDGGRLTSVTTLRCAEGAVREYLARFADDPFSPGATAFLDEALAPLFSRFGYERDPDSPYTTVAFAAADPPNAGDLSNAAGTPKAAGTPAESMKPLPEGVSLVECGEGEGERYDFSLIEGGADDGDCVLAVRGHTVLCAAGINDLRRDGYSEIYVECAESVRCLGLGSACAARLCARLLASGQGVRYETTGDNAASLALARSLGMREVERIVSFSALR